MEWAEELRNMKSNEKEEVGNTPRGGIPPALVNAKGADQAPLDHVLQR